MPSNRNWRGVVSMMIESTLKMLSRKLGSMGKRSGIKFCTNSKTPLGGDKIRLVMIIVLGNKLYRRLKRGWQTKDVKAFKALLKKGSTQDHDIHILLITLKVLHFLLLSRLQKAFSADEYLLVSTLATGIFLIIALICSSVLFLKLRISFSTV